VSDIFGSAVVQAFLALSLVVLLLAGLGWLKFRRDERLVTWVLKKSGVEDRRKRNAAKNGEVSPDEQDRQKAPSRKRHSGDDP
jgi:hypothetical protein